MDDAVRSTRSGEAGLRVTGFDEGKHVVERHVAFDGVRRRQDESPFGSQIEQALRLGADARGSRVG